jgi:EmrB/QacA subfamily drug resistance transporter
VDRPRPDALMLLVASAFFMENLDGTIIATAAPSMARTFGVRSADIGLAATAYLLTLAALIPLSGRVSDRFGARRVFASSIAVFTVASALCAATTSLPELAAARVLQGVGGAMMVPVGRLVVLRSTEKADLVRTIAYLTWPALAAPIAAPALGGLLTTYASWRWIFLINLPLGVLALFGARRLLPRSEPMRGGGLDWPGVALTVLGATGLVLSSSLVERSTVNWVAVLVSSALGVAFSVAAVGHLLRARSPLLDLRLFGIQTFRVSNAGGFVFRSTITAVPFLLPLLYQDGFGWSPLRSGAVVLFVFVGNLAIKPTTTPMLRRYGFRTVLIGATLFGSVSIALCGVLTRSTPLAVIVLITLAGGVFRSIGFTAYNTITFADVDSQRMAHANTLASTMQQLAIGFGVAFAALALRAGEASGGFVGHAVSTQQAFRFAFLLMAVAALLATVEAFRLPADAGRIVTEGARTR